MQQTKDLVVTIKIRYSNDLFVNASDTLTLEDWNYLMGTSKKISLVKVNLKPFLCQHWNVVLILKSKGDTISPNNGFFYILSGTIQMVHSGGKKLHLHQGEFFGEHYLFLSEKEQKMCDVQVMVEKSEMVQLLLFPFSLVSDCFDKQPALVSRLIKTFSLLQMYRILQLREDEEEKKKKKKKW